MSIARKVYLGQLSIAGGGAATESDAFDLQLGQAVKNFGFDEVILLTEEDAFTGNITVQFSDDATNYVSALVDGGAANYTLPAVSSVKVPVMGRYIRVKSDMAEADAATIELYGIERY
jgi:hypothetical protein